MKTAKNLILSFFIILFFAQTAFPQYFGRNKPRYRSFGFSVYETPHFDIYHYFQDKNVLDRYALWMETWYEMHQEALADTFYAQNPFILYQNHADFQQTNAISSVIGVGTGGVTEALKNRVVMPVTTTNQQTNHVIGHELVHAFQYNIILGGDSTSLRNLQNLPLWLVEGMAEYMSIGRHDSHTAMWMRDAIINDKLPTIKDLSNPRFFPYRYGQAFWAFMGGFYGDEVIKPFFLMTGKFGLSLAIDSVLGITQETLSSHFKNALTTYYEPLIGEKEENFIGEKLISEDNAGEMNISPAVSPDGKFVIFLSEKDLFTTDLFLAEVRTGKIIQKVASTVKDGHLDNLSFLESSGTWSPNSREFAFVAFSQGRQVLVVKDALSGKTMNEIELKDVAAISNPAWSPNGRHIAFTGLNEGQSDLYLYNTRTGSVEQLTDDTYSDIQADWSTDGSRLVFSTDRISMDNGRINGNWYFNLATLDINTREVDVLDFFRGADNLNPQYDKDDNIVFLSDRDGFRNIYKYEVETGRLSKMTDFKVGVSGITKYSPALSVSRKRDRILFSQYFDGKYSIYAGLSRQFLDETVQPDDVDFRASTLPVVGLDVPDIVNENLSNIDHREVEAADIAKYQEKKYRPNFKLDYVGGSAGGGVGLSNTFGTQTGLAGGVDLLFSDILGNNQLYTGLALNGEIYDIAGIFQYANKKGRFAFGGGISHIPNRTGFLSGFSVDTLQIGNQFFLANKLETSIVRIFQDGFSLFGQYPLSTTKRFEVDAGVNYQYFRIDRFDNYYDDFGRLIAQERERVKVEDDLVISGYLFKKGFLFSTNVAFVGDNSFFGLASPMQGHRYRFSIGKSFGRYNLTTGLADYRKYYFVRPVALAFRATHFGYYGNDAKNFFPIYLGQMGLVRGFPINQEAELLERYGIGFSQISGSKIGVTSFEIRLPFTGPERLTAIKSQFLFTELAAFVDGGVAFDEFSEFNGETSEGIPVPKPEAIFSAGLSLRVNLFGAMILEPYYAFPLRENSKGVWGINIVPGW